MRITSRLQVHRAAPRVAFDLVGNLQSEKEHDLGHGSGWRG